jgi:hypothetical protein
LLDQPIVLKFLQQMFLLHEAYKSVVACWATQIAQGMRPPMIPPKMLLWSEI